MQRMASMMWILVVVCAACGVRLDPKVPHDLGARREGAVGTMDTARGMPDRVGWGTFTVFAIPVAPVHIENGQGEKIVMDKVRETLTAAGYRVGDANGAGDGPVLQCDVKRFEFRNYTWLVPLVFTWGGVDLDVALVDRDGHPRWQHSYQGSAFNLTYSFSDAANHSMEEILQGFGRDVASDEFYRACCPPAAPPAADATAPPAPM